MPIVEFESVGATEILLGIDKRVASFEIDEVKMVEATDIVYAAVEEWYISGGEGSWPALAPSTIAGKARRGSAHAEDPLRDTDKLFDSATSAHGPYSFRMPAPDGIIMGVDWERGGWQIPVVHYYGTHTAGVGHNVTIPARPIWPAEGSMTGLKLIQEIGALFLRGI